MKNMSVLSRNARHEGAIAMGAEQRSCDIGIRKTAASWGMDAMSLENLLFSVDTFMRDTTLISFADEAAHESIRRDFGGCSRNQFGALRL
jgi:hypothetical protein